MKKRLLLLVLSILGGAQMQAGSWWDRFRNYSPYQWGSFKRYAPESVASRLATMRYLYGNDVTKNQDNLTYDYYSVIRDRIKYLLSKNDPDKNDLKLRNAHRLYGTLIPTVEAMEAELLRPGSYHQYQHPDQYILNY